jgi:serine/threonine protein kinase
VTGRHKHKPRKKRVSLKFQARNFVKTRHFGEELCEHYQLGEKIGEGAFGEVFAAVHKATGAERAVKVIYKGATAEAAAAEEEGLEEHEHGHEDEHEHEHEDEDEKLNAIIRNEFATVNSLDHVSLSLSTLFVLSCLVLLGSTTFNLY